MAGKQSTLTSYFSQLQATSVDYEPEFENDESMSSADDHNDDQIPQQNDEAGSSIPPACQQECCQKSNTLSNHR